MQEVTSILDAPSLAKQAKWGPSCLQQEMVYGRFHIQSPSVSKEQIAQKVSELVDTMSSRLGMLDLIAKIAPLVGILGTVIGMAVSFGGIGAIVSASPAAISNGISIALRTTAYGLIISIAASIASATFRRCICRATLTMRRIARDTYIPTGYGKPGYYPDSISTSRQSYH